MDTEYVLFKRSREHVRSPYDADTVIDEIRVIPESLALTLKDATPEEMQVIADAVMCLMAGGNLCVFCYDAEWYAATDAWNQQTGETRAEALHALAEAVQSELQRCEPEVQG